MRAMDVGVEAAASPQCMVPLQARLELVNAIGQLNVSTWPSHVKCVCNFHIRICLVAQCHWLGEYKHLLTCFFIAIQLLLLLAFVV